MIESNRINENAAANSTIENADGPTVIEVNLGDWASTPKQWVQWYRTHGMATRLLPLEATRLFQFRREPRMKPLTLSILTSCGVARASDLFPAEPVMALSIPFWNVRRQLL